MNSNYSTDVLTTTLEKWTESTLTDNIFDSNALFRKIKERGAYKACDGGERILEPLLYGKNSTAGSYDGYDTLDTTPQQGMTNAEFEWKQYSVQVVIDGKSERQNSGKQAAVNLIESKFMQAEGSLVDQLNQGLHGDGTGNGGKDLTGVDIAIDSTGTYGNIARATYSYWAAYEESTSATLTISYVRNLVSGASSGGRDIVDLHITTDTLFNKFEDLLQTNQRYADVKSANVGFDNITYRNGMITWDEGTATGYWFGINTKYMNLRYHPAADFTVRPFVEPDNQDIKIAKILWMGNLTCSNCRRQGKLTGKTAS